MPKKQKTCLNFFVKGKHCENELIHKLVKVTQYQKYSSKIIRFRKF